VITPKAIEYDYKLMFEDRTITILTYNKETLLAEKMQTIINRGIANTRLRDFYDVYSIMNFYNGQIEQHILYDAFCATCEKRKTSFAKKDIEDVLNMIANDIHMAERWIQFQKSNFYVGDLEWEKVIDFMKNTIKVYWL
jgi:predicted nucleotidyltransferase component of viral defense system